MTHLQRVYHSFVHFRPNPADDGGAVLLGMVLGFHTEKFWAVGMAMRGSLPARLIEALDPLSKAMLENRSEILKSQISSQFEACSKPDEVIAAVVSDNFTSFYMAPMKAEMVDLTIKPSDASMEKLAEDYVLTLFQKRHVEAASLRSRVGAVPGEFEGLPLSDSASPPPWMTGTQIWYKPNVHT